MFLRILSFVAFFLFPTLGKSEKLIVQSANYPLHYFAERIATNSFDLRYRIDPDSDPAFWKPSDDDLIAFQQADIILRNGATYSKWMHYASLSSSKIVDTTREARDQFIKTQGEVHSHGDGTVHSHGGVAFTTWMDFDIAKIQAKAIARRFAAMRPAEAKEVEENLDALVADLETLNNEAKQIGKKLVSKPLIGSHSIYQYFSRAYGLNLETLDWDPTMEFGQKQELELKELLASHDAKVMIWESKPSIANVEKLKKLGIDSIIISPAANRPKQGDFLSTMRTNLDSLRTLIE